MIPPPTKGMVLAAGLGTRMRPLTNSRPKPLINVAGHSLLDRALDWMANSGIKEVVVNTHYLSAQIEAHLQRRIQPHIILSPENEELLETGGGIARALPHLGEDPFICANSDTICIDGPVATITRLAQHWNDARMDALLLLHPVEKAIGYEGKGDFSITKTGNLSRRADAPFAPYIFTGIQLLHPRLFKECPLGAFSMNQLYDRNLSRVAGLVHEGDWLHVGDPKGLTDAENWLHHH